MAVPHSCRSPLSGRVRTFHETSRNFCRFRPLSGYLVEHEPTSVKRNQRCLRIHFSPPLHSKKAALSLKKAVLSRGYLLCCSLWLICWQTKCIDEDMKSHTQLVYKHVGQNGLTAANFMSLFISADGWRTLVFMSATNKTKKYC